MILVYVESDADGSVDEVSREALTFARSLSAAGGGIAIDVVVVGDIEGRDAGGLRRPQRPPGRRRRLRGVRRRRARRRRAGRPGGRRLGRGAGRRQPPRHRGAGARRGPRGRGDGRQRGVLRRAGAVRGHPSGGRWRGDGGDAPRPAAGGLHRRRARRRGERRPTLPGRPRSRRWRSRSATRTWWPGCAAPARTPPARPATSSRRGSWSAPVAAQADRTGFAGVVELAELLGGTARRLPGGHQPGLAAPPRAGRPDRDPDLPGGLHPLRDQRRHPALGGLRELEGDPRRSTPTRRRRWSPRRRTP